MLHRSIPAPTTTTIDMLGDMLPSPDHVHFCGHAPTCSESRNVMQKQSPDTHVDPRSENPAVIASIIESLHTIEPRRQKRAGRIHSIPAQISSSDVDRYTTSSPVDLSEERTASPVSSRSRRLSHSTFLDRPAFLRRSSSILKRLVRPLSIVTTSSTSHSSTVGDDHELDRHQTSSRERSSQHFKLSADSSSSSGPTSGEISGAAATQISSSVSDQTLSAPPRTIKRRPVSRIYVDPNREQDDYVLAPSLPRLATTSRSVISVDNSLSAKSPVKSDRSPMFDVIPKRLSSIGKPDKQNSQPAPIKSVEDKPREKLSTRTASRAKRKPLMSEQVLHDLGDEDGTVKRIRELKQQRASRLMTDLPIKKLQEQLAQGESSPERADSETNSEGTSARSIKAMSSAPAEHRTSGIMVDSTKPQLLSTEPERLPPTLDPGQKSILQPMVAGRIAVGSPPFKHKSIRSLSETPTGRDAYLDPYDDDDITERVEAFLEDHRLSQTAACARTGRKISFSEVGDPHGAVVFVCVGMGLSRFVSAFYDELATSLRLRLITPERPGVGDSESYAEQSKYGPMAWHQDVIAICQKLQITRFSLLGHSAGAIYALSTALALPTFVHGSVQLLAPWIPPSQFSTGPMQDDVPTVGALPRSQRLLRVLPVSVLKAANASFLAFNTGSMSPPTKRTNTRRDSSSPSPRPRSRLNRQDGLASSRSRERGPSNSLDRSSSNSPRPSMPVVRADSPNEEEAIQMSATASPVDLEFSLASSALSASEHLTKSATALYSSLLVERIWELSTKNTSPATDLLVCLERESSVGFRYADVQQRVAIFHGDQDKRVPVENVRWLAARMNRRKTFQATVDGGADVMDGAECDLQVLPGEGHGLMASAVVMSKVLTDISDEVHNSRRQ